MPEEVWVDPLPHAGDALIICVTPEAPSDSTRPPRLRLAARNNAADSEELGRAVPTYRASRSCTMRERNKPIALSLPGDMKVVVAVALDDVIGQQADHLAET